MTVAEPVEPDLTAAALTLQVAVDQLVEPGVVKLQRDIPQPGTTAWQLMADDNALQRDLEEQLARAHHADDEHAAHRAAEGLDQLAARRAARTTTSAPVPPLLEQLLDEIPNSGDNGGGRSSGGSRLPLAPDALDMAREIALAVGQPFDDRLVSHVRAWAADAYQFPELLVFRADTAAPWPDRIRAILTPTKPWRVAGRCPDCNRDTAWVEHDGETVRLPAIELDRANNRARCLCCPARWVGDAALASLERVLREQQQTGRPRLVSSREGSA